MTSIFRGPQRRIPETVNLPVAGGYQPGLIVTSDGSELTEAAVATDDLLILAEDIMNPASTNVDVAYTIGDTGIAYQPVPGDTYAVRAAAGTYAIGDPLTVNGSGQVAPATTADATFGYAVQAGTLSAGDLLDVKISDRVAAA